MNGLRKQAPTEIEKLNTIGKLKDTHYSAKVSNQNKVTFLCHHKQEDIDYKTKDLDLRAHNDVWFKNATKTRKKTSVVARIK